MLDTKNSYTELLLAEDDGLDDIIVSTFFVGDFVMTPDARNRGPVMTLRNDSQTEAAAR